MDEIDVSEGIFARGWIDTKRAMHTVWFWALDAGGGAMMGLLDPIWGVVWFIGGFVMLWIGATAGAPFKQRTEARQSLSKKLDKYMWVGLEDGGRHYRDLMAEYGMSEGVRQFDSMSSPHPKQPTSSPVASAFRWVVQEAINEGKMEVWGIPENGSKPERLEKVDDDATAYRKSREGDSFFLMMDGVYYRGLQIKRSTIKSYAEYVRKHDADLKARVKGGQPKAESLSLQSPQKIGS